MIEDSKLLAALGKRIKAVRKERGLTQERLAELCEYDPTYISLLERGKRNPPFTSLCRLSNKLSVTISELVTGIKS